MEIAEERIQQAIDEAMADLESKFSAGPWRLTTNAGSKLLYCGDSYAGKLSPPMHFEVLRKLTEYERLQNTRVSLEAEIRRLNKIIDELNEAAIDAGDVP